MNKNSILNLVTGIMVIVLNVGFVSCSKDDSNSKDNDYKNNDIVGTWKGYSCADGNPEDLSQNHTLTLVFSPDGFGNYLEIDNPYTDQCSFTYELESNTKGKAYIKVRGTIYFEIIENKMYVYGHGYGNDLDFLLTKQ